MNASPSCIKQINLQLCFISLTTTWYKQEAANLSPYLFLFLQSTPSLGIMLNRYLKWYIFQIFKTIALVCKKNFKIKIYARIFFKYSFISGSIVRLLDAWHKMGAKFEIKLCTRVRFKYITTKANLANLQSLLYLADILRAANHFLAFSKLCNEHWTYLILRKVLKR